MNLRDVVVDGNKFELINGGGFGKIYRVNPELVVKIVRTPSTIERQRTILEGEYTIQRALFEKSISVPVPIGVLDLQVDRWSVVPGFFMQYIKGVNLSELSKDEYKEINEMVKREIEKAKDLGFVIGFDAHSKRNSIYGVNGRIYLIDFMHWEMPDVTFPTQTSFSF
ncbi:hypothetical protein HYT24_00665 [Candidatus Pacearchaeota archaeon]|nr:hypothetical protein [Candidatus Pacearchaeota archaeon]